MSAHTAEEGNDDLSMRFTQGSLLYYYYQIPTQPSLILRWLGGGRTKVVKSERRTRIAKVT